MIPTTDLPTPTVYELIDMWPDRAIFPQEADERRYMEDQVFHHLQLDRANPAHRAHVEALVETCLPRSCSRVRSPMRAND